MAQAGGFDTIPGGPVTKLHFIRASGGRVPGETVSFDGAEVSQLADGALQALEALVTAFRNPNCPFPAMRRQVFQDGAYRYDDYAHLARLQEWQAGGGEE